MLTVLVQIEHLAQTVKRPREVSRGAAPSGCQPVGYFFLAGSKLAKAEKLGIDVVDEEAFITLMKSHGAL